MSAPKFDNAPVGTIIVHPATDIPGLCDVRTPDGRWLKDLTRSQVLDLCRRESWDWVTA